MRILVLNGSPKKQSDTMELTKSFLEGLNAETENEVEILNIIDMNVKPCRGCFGCWQKLDGHCVMNDDQNMILDKYKTADIVIWSFPLYCFGLPSHIKAVLDRMIPMVKMDMVEKDGEVRHVCNENNLNVQRTVVICGAGFPYSKGNFDGVKVTSLKCFHDPTMIFVPETPMMNVPDAKPLADIKRAKFVKAGQEFIRDGKLCDNTIAELESLMIPNEQYIQIVNGN